jgi:hypothetical protein
MSSGRTAMVTGVPTARPSVSQASSWRPTRTEAGPLMVPATKFMVPIKSATKEVRGSL